MWLFQTKTQRSPYFHSGQMIFSEPREEAIPSQRHQCSGIAPL